MPYLLAQPAAQWPPYVWAERVLSPSECVRVRGYARACAPVRARVGDAQGQHDAKTRVTDVWWLEHTAHTAWLYERLTHLIAFAQQWYAFRLSAFVEPLQLTRYLGVDGGHYIAHRDMASGGTMSTRKLSLVVHLSPPTAYDGGALAVHSIPGPDSTVPQRALGCGVVFPAWEMHSVAPVTCGERWTLVAWVHGPPFC